MNLIGPVNSISSSPIGRCGDGDGAAAGDRSSHVHSLPPPNIQNSLLSNKTQFLAWDFF